MRSKLPTDGTFTSIVLTGLGSWGYLTFLFVFFLVLWWFCIDLGCFGKRLFIVIILGFGFFVVILVLFKGRYELSLQKILGFIAIQQQNRFTLLTVVPMGA